MDTQPHELFIEFELKMRLLSTHSRTSEWRGYEVTAFQGHSRQCHATPITYAAKGVVPSCCAVQVSQNQICVGVVLEKSSREKPPYRSHIRTHTFAVHDVVRHTILRPLETS